ncbi:MAG: alpha/beta fold hydrolase [Clostridiales bacterium]|nr:alpha/beta fold hydrolase [Clostridiales bacterium]
MKLYYTENGEGKPLILLHGNGESGRYFEHQIPFFSRKYRVLALDTRGHGDSPRGNAPFTIAQFAEDLLDFMNEHAIEKAHLLGFSDGGNIALTFALRYPERVDRLILNGANLDPSGVRLSVQAPIVLGYHIASWFSRKSKEAQKNAELLGLMVKQPHIRAERLETLHVPTLVIAGSRDMIKRRHTLLIYQSIPDARLEILRGDHFIAARKPNAFNQAVERFLESD